MGIISGAANLYFIYRFLRILTTAWEDSDAFKLGIVDEKGKILKKKNKLKGKEEKEAYTMMHRFVWKLKRLLEKIPFGKSRMASYAAALWLIKEEKEFHGTDEELQESFLSFLETDWKDDALILKENYEGDMDKKTYNNLKEGFKDLPPHLQKSLKDYAKKQKKLAKSIGVKVKTFAFNPKTGKPDIEIEEKAPPGWEGTVKAMKKKKGIDNPYSLAWYMKNKGDKSRIPEEVEATRMPMQAPFKLDEIAPWKKGKYKVTDGKTGKILGTFSSGQKAQKYVDKIWDKGDYDSLTVELGEKVVYTRGVELDEKWKAGVVYHQDFGGGEISYFRADSVLKNKRWKGMGVDEYSGKQKKPRNITADEKVQGWEITPKNKIPKGLKEEVEIEEKKSHTGYELYHKDFSSAMQHAYDYAKKKGHIVDKKEIDDKVATGPKKPSKGKTNRYSLKAGRKKVEIQVYNMGKKYELNMYIEGVVIESTKEYAKSLEKIANDKKMSMLSRSEKRTLLKIADMLAKERKEGVELDEDQGDEEHKALVQFKARWLMKQALKSGKRYNQQWWNKQARIAGFAKGADAVKVLTTILDTKKEEVELTLKNYDPNSPEEDEEEQTEAKFKKGQMVSKKDQKRYREKEISHKDYLKHGAGKGGKQWTTGSGKNLKYWTHSKEEVEWSVSSFNEFITEGRAAGKIRSDENTTINKERQKLVDSQEKNYTLKDIESIARKYKIRFHPLEPPMKFGPEWSIITDKGIKLNYDKRENATEVTGWRIDKKKLRQYKDKYENEETRIQDVTAGKGRGKLSLRGFESAFEVIGEQLIEDVAANATGAAVVGTGDDPTVWRRKKRKNAKVETEEFGGKKVFVVSPERYWDSRMGKSRYNRYEKYVGNDKLGETIRQYGITNPKSPIILKNSETGAMLYLKYGK